MPIEITETPDGVGTAVLDASHLSGPSRDAEHRGDRVAVDVGVEDADRAASLGQREREVDRDRRLADAALAAGDREHLGQRTRLGERDLLGRLAAAEVRLEPARCSAVIAPRVISTR
jgi:hypothetical protein